MKPGDENGSGGTLSGKKRLVYVMMKILKKCYEDVNITSFKVLEIEFTPFLPNSCGWAGVDGP